MPTNRKEYQRNYSNYYRKLRQKLGICHLCSQPLCSKNYCKEHLEAQREKRRAYRQKKRSMGQCIHCSQPARLGITTCIAHATSKQQKRSRYHSLKGNAKRRTIKFLINKKDFDGWYSEQTCCYYCGISIQELVGKPGKSGLATIDRKDNNLPYELTNICLACYRCNNLKSNFFSSEEWLEIANKYIKPKIALYHNR